jgi:phospholipid/cholesterol/gamma-HCH transport system permease protein
MLQRIGAAFTAELGTMVSEVEAIEAMGIGPLQLPSRATNARCLADVSLHGFERRPYSPAAWSTDLFSIAFPYFFDLVKDSLLIRDIITGILKSFLFGLLIAAIACYRVDSERQPPE